MELQENDSKIFIMIVSIITTLLVLTIYERYVLDITSNKKTKINVLYFNRVLNTIHNAKIILITSFCTLFMILINPISLLRIFNPYIFDIIGNSGQFSGIIKFMKINNTCKDKGKSQNYNYEYFTKDYIDVKNNDVEKLSKTINEVVFSKSYENILKRIKKDFNFDFNIDELFNLFNSIYMDNKLYKLDTTHIDKIFENIPLKNNIFMNLKYILKKN